MKNIIKIISILFIGFLFGVISILLIHNKAPFAYITLNNNSAKDIKFVKIINESKENIQLVEDIKVNNSKKLKFYVAGESGYSIEVMFKDGSTIYREEQYIETGYRITEKIKSDKIESDFSFWTFNTSNYMRVTRLLNPNFFIPIQIGTRNIDKQTLLKFYNLI